MAGRTGGILGKVIRCRLAVCLTSKSVAHAQS